MVSALIATIVIATLAVLTALWAIHRSIQVRLDNMAAQAIIDRRRARTQDPQSPENRRARFRLIHGGGITAIILAAGAWIYNHTLGLGTRTVLAAAGSSTLLLGGGASIEDTTPTMTLPVITTDTPHQPPSNQEQPPDLGTATGTQQPTDPEPVDPVTPSPNPPAPETPPQDTGHTPPPEPTENLPPPEPDDECRIGVGLLGLNICL